MKKITILITYSILSVSVFAQIPNAGFETWNNMGNYFNPAQWGTMNNTTASSGVYTATKATPGNPGSSYMQLTSKTTPAGVVNGIAVSGKLDSITMQPKSGSGFAFNQRPASFTGAWQYMTMGSSPGSISVTLSYEDTIMHMLMTAATANQTLSGMAMSWTNFSIPFSYLNGHTPDYCTIVLKASGSTPANGDYLWVDNLAFSGTVASVKGYGSFVNSINVYPSPSSENIFVDFNLSRYENIKIQIVDLSGKAVKEVDLGSVNGAIKYSMNIDGVAKGAYFINVIASEGTEAKKIVIK